jgi:hypothetical protein
MEPELIIDADANVIGTSFRCYLNHPYSFEEAIGRLYQLSGYN